jgi:hypothetical protein
LTELTISRTQILIYCLYFDLFFLVLVFVECALTLVLFLIIGADYDKQLRDDCGRQRHQGADSAKNENESKV